MKNVKKRLEDRDTIPDNFDVYGKYVASELRNIKDEYSTLIAKQYINNILIDARIGKYRQEYQQLYCRDDMYSGSDVGYRVNISLNLLLNK